MQRGDTGYGHHPETDSMKNGEPYAVRRRVLRREVSTRPLTGLGSLCRFSGLVVVFVEATLYRRSLGFKLVGSRFLLFPLRSALRNTRG
jgi:hypothetical protein